MRSPARGWAAVCAALVLGGSAFAVRLGPLQPGPVQAGDAHSAVWICPHGGGAGWDAEVAIANPGQMAVQVRVRSLGPDGAVSTDSFGVPAGMQIVRGAEAQDRGSATVVEVFGGWAGVAWQVRAGGDQHGLGVEPCTPTWGSSWHVSGLSTLQGESSFLIVTNPFATAAVIDAVVFAPDSPPVRDPDWSGLSLSPNSSIALPLSSKVPGKAAVVASVTARAGRVGVAGLGVTQGGGLRSVLGQQGLASTWLLPTAAGSGQSTLVVGILGERAVRFGAVLRSENEPQSAGGLVDVRQGALSVGSYPVITSSVASVDLRAQAALAAALLSEGRDADDAATAGATAPATDWLVLPTASEEPWRPALVVSNPGAADVEVELRSIPIAGVHPVTLSFTVPAGRVVAAPEGFLREVGRGAVLVRASGPVLALGAATSSGRRGLALYGQAVGVSVPPWVLSPT